MAVGDTVFQCDRAVATFGSVDFFDPAPGQAVTVNADLYEPNGSGGFTVQGKLTFSYEPEPLGYGHVIPLEYNKRYVVTISEWVEP